MKLPAVKRVTIELEWETNRDGLSYLALVSNTVEGYIERPSRGMLSGVRVTREEIEYVERRNPNAIVAFEGHLTDLNTGPIISAVKDAIAQIGAEQ